MAHLTLANWQTSSSYGKNQVIHLSLLVAATLLINEEVPFNPNPSIKVSLSNPRPMIIERVVGTYFSPLGKVELFTKGEELHGSLLNHEFKLEEVGSGLLSRSGYKPLDGLVFYVESDTLKLNTMGTPFPFAYRIEDEGN